MRGNASLSRWALCIVLALAMWGMPAQARVNVGVVLDVSGEWRLWEKGRNVGMIERGQAITSGSSVRPRSDEGWVVIHLRNDKVIKCEVGNLRECATPLVLPRSSSAAGGFFRVILNIFTRRPTDFQPAFTRAPIDERLREAVVVIEGGAVDLGPPFETLRAGRYRLRMIPVGPYGRPKRLDPFDFNWEPGARSKVSVPGLTPGLYRILLLDRRKNDEPNGIESWVLVSDTVQFPRISARFGKAAAWARGWREDVAGDAEKTFLRVYLDSLARPVEGTGPRR